MIKISKILFPLICHFSSQAFTICSPAAALDIVFPVLVCPPPILSYLTNICSQMESGGPQAEIIEKINGVKLTKSLQFDSYQIPSVTLEFTSNRRDTATVTVRDPIPDGLSVKDVGFHRQFGKEHWKVDEDQLVFEYDLEPDEEYKTVYGFHPGRVDQCTNLLTSPNSIKVTSKDAPGDEAKPVSRSAAESPYHDEKSTQMDAIASGEDSETSGGGDRKDQPIADTLESEFGIESIADRLAEELEDGDVSEATIEILEEHLTMEASSSAGEDVRLGQIQKDVMDLRAYINALEAFLDKEGSAEDIIEEFERKINDLEGKLKDQQARIGNLESRVETLESELHKVDNSMSSVSNELQELRSEMKLIDQKLRSIHDRIPAYSIDDRFADLSEELESINKFVNDLKTAFE